MPTFAQNDDDEDDDQTSDEPAEASSEESSDDSGAGEASSEDDAGGESPPADLEPKAGGEAGQLPPPDTDKQQAMRDYLAKQYDKAADPSAVKAALADSQRMNRAANVGSAVEGLFRARSQAYGGDGVDEKYYDRMRAEGAQGVQQAQAARDAQIKDFLTKQQLGRQAAQDQQTQAIKQQQIDAGDPSSRSSQIARAAFSANFPDIAGAMGKDFANLSTQDLGKISQITDTKAKIEAAKQAAAANHELARARLDAQAGQKNTERDIAFAGKFEKSKADYTKASNEIDNQLSLIEQAKGKEGGIAGQLLQGGMLHGAFGRVSQGELPLAKDPAVDNKLDELWGRVTNGESLSEKDVREYERLLRSRKDNQDKSWASTAKDMTDTNDRVAQHPAGYSAAKVGLNAAKETAGGAGGPKKQTHPVGSTVTLRNGKQYKVVDAEGNLEEIPKMAAASP